ncbi:MAG: hypothetical protein ACRDZ8_20285 [Acidimicrobiales bacterium]
MSRARRVLVLGGLLVGLALMSAACTGNDNGGVITGTTPTSGATTTVPTSTTLSGGTLPNS